MFRVSTDPAVVDRQRPFKVFISLLDRWEIGALLTEDLVLDCFRALEAALKPDDVHDEVTSSLFLSWETGSRTQLAAPYDGKHALRRLGSILNMEAAVPSLPERPASQQRSDAQGLFDVT